MLKCSIHTLKCPSTDRVLLESNLEPLQGSRFQPTGFPSLGSAEFTVPDKNIKSLLVESAQSMANRLEMVCVNKTDSSLVEPLTGMPLIRVNDEKGEFMTNSIMEAHRMNSSYILKSKDQTMMDKLKNELNIHGKDGAINIPKFAKFVLKYDTNSVLHGLFLSDSDLAGGRYKLTRALSSFIEATDIQPAVSGGVKLDHLSPSGGDGDAKTGYGHIPYSRTEYVAKSIKAYFNIDLALIRSYSLGESANDLLYTLALWKICSFLNSGLRLRTACDLRTTGPLVVTYPDELTIPDIDTLNDDVKRCINTCQKENLLTDNPLVLTYKKK